MLQALAEIPYVVPPIWPLQGSPGTQVRSTSGHWTHPRQLHPQTLGVPPSLYPKVFQVDFLLT